MINPKKELQFLAGEKKPEYHTKRLLELMEQLEERIKDLEDWKND